MCVCQLAFAILMSAVYPKHGSTAPLPLEPSLEIADHSPDGFNWGYDGSGSGQLALGILYKVTGDQAFHLQVGHLVEHGRRSDRFYPSQSFSKPVASLIPA